MENWDNSDFGFLEMHVVLRLGGILKTQTTGEYPEHLIIMSERYKRTWRVKLKDENQTGVLNSNKQPVYNYKYQNGEFSYQRIEENKVVTDWITIQGITTELLD
jgi:hypothetical protein